ncbi:hypothetical protein SERLADRAFT_353386 [Serpula lacrymans var. lacrymans S7.9]|uniref:Uncharacterized protein n=1 Tax=Serpula lacrymans var. lacrymans (strain S7.9) TaxID=578457 RepID=F8PEM9_SERL9|nr:uncharacterized protein SERLADRAFT_353386 [Serpula lacrymans var. lacrymans S7.9]XP_007324865.1 uncharacterized protein SERLADRAFT_353395 [Serpula lacrymans var. lacrymans S7.9]EGO18410.1 hypothetical protein SERLADRAFT_353395 [Serpula lacrymans var. lacrymans S7.9]EGO18425.1 hypothetical protein SERLADRAFT_353386 [Serpula lacrymans var. lacrymans S7.9]
MSPLSIHFIADLSAEANGLDCKMYPLSRDKHHHLDEFLDENLKSGYIQVSKSPYTSPFF